MEHQLTKDETNNVYTCLACGWTWQRKPSTDCPGVTVYAWEHAPENLKTKGQLKTMRLKPGNAAQPKGCLPYKGRWLLLYDENEAIPTRKLTPKQEAALKRGRTIKHCSICDQDVPRYDYDDHVRWCPCKVWARKLLATNDWLIIDTETTGLDGDDEVVQIGVLSPLSNVVVMDTLVKPSIPIPPGASSVHGITDETVAAAMSFTEVCPALFDALMRCSRVVFYNAEFDIRLLRQTCRRYGLQLPEFRWDCAMLVYAQWYGQWSSYYCSWKYQPLPGGDHSAIGDCRATFDLIKLMAGEQ